MMRFIRSLARRSDGTAAIEFAVAVPVLVMMVWGMFQIGMLMRANAGMQHALGEAARYATIFPTPSDADIQARVASRKFGTNGGTLSALAISNSTSGGVTTKTLSLQYQRPLDFLLFDGPTVTLQKSKVVYTSD
jgi:Flp pilus assembly protein TadG